MLLFFEPKIGAETNVTLLQSPSPFNADQWTTVSVRVWVFCYSATLIWIGGKEENKNI